MDININSEWLEAKLFYFSVGLVFGGLISFTSYIFFGRCILSNDEPVKLPQLRKEKPT